jgi:hypothetical protein
MGPIKSPGGKECPSSQDVSLNLAWQGFLFYHEKSDTHSHLYAGNVYGCDITFSHLEASNLICLQS